MNRSEMILNYEFVEFIPSNIEEGKLYISLTYATVTHKCCCGCSKEVVTPLSPTDWKMTFDGQSISLDPSIGNWSFNCQSHYWIRRNRVIWAETWSKKRIEDGRSYDHHIKNTYYDQSEVRHPMKECTQKKNMGGFWSKICKLCNFNYSEK